MEKNLLKYKETFSLLQYYITKDYIFYNVIYVLHVINLFIFFVKFF